MKKYFIITLAFTLLLTSCFKKEEPLENSTGNISTSSISTGNMNTKEIVENTGEIEEIGTSSTEVNEEVKLGDIIENGDNVTYRDIYKGYEINFKKVEELDIMNGEKIFPIDLVVAGKKSGNSIGFIVSPIPEEYSGFEDYYEKFSQNIEKTEGVKNFKKQNTEISGLKGYKITYDLKGSQTEQYLLLNDKTIFFVTIVLTNKSSEKQFLDILNGLKIIK